MDDLTDQHYEFQLGVDCKVLDDIKSKMNVLEKYPNLKRCTSLKENIKRIEKKVQTDEKWTKWFQKASEMKVSWMDISVRKESCVNIIDVILQLPKEEEILFDLSNNPFNDETFQFMDFYLPPKNLEIIHHFIKAYVELPKQTQKDVYFKIQRLALVHPFWMYMSNIPDNFENSIKYETVLKPLMEKWIGDKESFSGLNLCAMFDILYPILQYGYNIAALVPHFYKHYTDTRKDHDFVIDEINRDMAEINLAIDIQTRLTTTLNPTKYIDAITKQIKDSGKFHLFTDVSSIKAIEGTYQAIQHAQALNQVIRSNFETFLNIKTTQDLLNERKNHPDKFTDIDLVPELWNAIETHQSFYDSVRNVGRFDVTKWFQEDCSFNGGGEESEGKQRQRELILAMLFAHPKLLSPHDISWSLSQFRYIFKHGWNVWTQIRLMNMGVGWDIVPFDFAIEFYHPECVLYKLEQVINKWSIDIGWNPQTMHVWPSKKYDAYQVCIRDINYTWSKTNAVCQFIQTQFASLISLDEAIFLWYPDYLAYVIETAGQEKKGWPIVSMTPSELFVKNKEQKDKSSEYLDSRIQIYFHEALDFEVMATFRKKYLILDRIEKYHGKWPKFCKITQEEFVSKLDELGKTIFERNMDSIKKTYDEKRKTEIESKETPDRYGSFYWWLDDKYKESKGPFVMEKKDFEDWKRTHSFDWFMVYYKGEYKLARKAIVTWGKFEVLFFDYTHSNENVPLSDDAQILNIPLVCTIDGKTQEFSTREDYFKFLESAKQDILVDVYSNEQKKWKKGLLKSIYERNKDYRFTVIFMSPSGDEHTSFFSPKKDPHMDVLQIWQIFPRGTFT